MVKPLKFDEWPHKTIGHLFNSTSSFVHHFKSIGEIKLELQSGNAQFGSKLVIFVPCDLEIWWITLRNNRALLLYYAKLWASFQSHWWIQTWVIIRKRSIRVKISDFFVPCDLEIWWMTLRNNRAPQSQHWLDKVMVPIRCIIHYVNQRWPNSLMHICITRTQWVEINKNINGSWLSNLNELDADERKPWENQKC